MESDRIKLCEKYFLLAKRVHDVKAAQEAHLAGAGFGLGTCSCSNKRHSS